MEDRLASVRAVDSLASHRAEGSLKDVDEESLASFSLPSFNLSLANNNNLLGNSLGNINKIPKALPMTTTIALVTSTAYPITASATPTSSSTPASVKVTPTSSSTTATSPYAASATSTISPTAASATSTISPTASKAES